MKPNVSEVERVIFVLLGAAIMCAGIYFRSWWGLVGILFLVRGTIGWCPLYQVLKKGKAA